MTQPVTKKLFLRPGRMFAGSALLCLCFLSPAGAGESVQLVKVPELSPKKRGEYPLNVARANLGASIKSSKLIPTLQDLTRAELALSPDSLISNDETLAYPVSAGKTSFIITLPFICATDNFAFFKEGEASGTVTVSVAAMPAGFKSSKWREVGVQDIGQGTQPVNVLYPRIEGMAVKIDFQMSQGCHVSAFGLFGDRLNTGVQAAPRVGREPLPLSQTAYFNYADISSSQASVCYISSGAGQANSILDDNAYTSLDFDAGDQSPVAIIDLAQRQSIQRVSMLYQGFPKEKLSVYLFDELPKNWAPAGTQGKDRPEKLVIPSSFFAENRPRSFIHLESAEGKASLPFELSGSRYLMLMVGTPPAFATRNTQAELRRSPVLAPLFSMLMMPVAQAPGSGPAMMEFNVFGNTFRSHFTVNPTPVQNLQTLIQNSLQTSPNPPNTGLVTPPAPPASP